MYVCMYVRMYVCMYVRMYICVCVCVYIYICRYTSYGGRIVFNRTNLMGDENPNLQRTLISPARYIRLQVRYSYFNFLICHISHWQWIT